MLKLNYQIHIILQSKYKFLFNIILYFIIMLIYTLYLNNTPTECMMRSNSFPSLHADTLLANNSLELGSLELTEQNLSLKQELQKMRELCLTERTENEYARGILEENQRYLIHENRHLRSNLLEAEQTIGKMGGENVELRTNLEYQKQYIKALNRNLETYRKHIDDLSTEIEVLKANLAAKK